MNSSFSKSWKVVVASFVLLTSLFGQVAAYDNCNSCDPCSSCEDECGSFIVGADWLYWKTNACGLSYGSFFTGDFSNSDKGFVQDRGEQMKNVSFDWDSGVRLYAGWREPCGKWDGMLKWTHLNTSASGSFANDVRFDDGGVSLFLSSWKDSSALSSFFTEFGVTTGEQESSAKWKLDLDMIDLELGREFLICDCVAMRPHIGLRFVRLDQKYTTALATQLDFDNEALIELSEENITQKISMKNNFKGVGLRSGLDADWCFGCFGVYGNAGASLVYGRFDLSRSDQSLVRVDVEGVDTFKASNDFHTTRPISDLGLGVRWDQSFDCDRMNLSIKLGWEHHYFWDQNNFIRSSGLIADSKGGIESVLQTEDCSRGGIGFQGLTLSASLEF